MAELVCINAQCSFCFQTVWFMNFCLITNFIDNNKNKTTTTATKTKSSKTIHYKKAIFFLKKDFLYQNSVCFDGRKATQVPKTFIANLTRFF